MLAGGNGLADSVGAATGRLRVEINGVIGIGEDLVEVGAPLGRACAGTEFTQLAFASANEDGVGHDDFIRSDAEATLLDDRINRADEVLVCAHASGDAVHDDSNAVCFHIFLVF